MHRILREHLGSWLIQAGAGGDMEEGCHQRLLGGNLIIPSKLRTEVLTGSFNWELAMCVEVEGSYMLLPEGIPSTKVNERTLGMAINKE